MVVHTKKVKLFSNPESRQLLKNKIEQVLNFELKDITWSNLRVETDGYVFINIDLKEKSEEMGELGFSQLVYLSGVEFNDTDVTSDEVIKLLEEEIQIEKVELLSGWRKVKNIFNKRFENTPVEQIPTGRTKEHILKEIYQDI
ncbi:hypothetical protein [Virgibacillus halodenitrificans]|uniref:hypothetical protein n=1 Tax=Virgibacillus halodenitrificans TaxID=1482 RepID=UPI000EF4E35F|nr:hypothetical protein [Virgibacillus halodenitrificans]